MGAFFWGGERVQRGKGLGGFIRLASKLFTPLKKVAQKALTSNTGKKVVSAVKEQAIDSSINLAKDIASGKDLKTSLKDELSNIKGTAKRKAIDIGLDILESQKKKKPKKQNIKFQRRKKQRNIFG